MENYDVWTLSLGITFNISHYMNQYTILWVLAFVGGVWSGDVLVHIMCMTIFMLYLQIYCPYKHEWKVAALLMMKNTMSMREKTFFFLFVCCWPGLGGWWCKVEFALNEHIHTHTHTKNGTDIFFYVISFLVPDMQMLFNIDPWAHQSQHCP